MRVKSSMSLAMVALLPIFSACDPHSEVAEEIHVGDAERERAERFEELGRVEVVELHRFIEEWSNGVLPDDDASYARFADALAPDFVLISPDGSSTDYASIVESFRSAHGRWLDENGAPSGTLRIEAVETVGVSPPLAMISYEEWQELPGGTLARLSTVLFRESETAPGGVQWVHLHESWLPGSAPKGE